MPPTTADEADENAFAAVASSSAAKTQTDDHADASTSDADPTPQSAGAVFASGDWQAIYDPQSGRYYFRHLTTNETTWQNPFEADSGASAPEPSSSSGIDPELAYLDPASRTGSSSANPLYSARFNARTGRFEGDPSFDPSRVSEYARGRKQASAYFDVDGWEQSLETSQGRVAGTAREIRAREISEGKKLTKAEIARFRERKQAKRSARQRAWLLE